ncbi:MAG: hypothetical protein KKB30_04435 [Proteobacteria bacterium]|nr:hypothetical protein [Pseudomonadota bacterium]MBU1716476.1 hypothetical protein [Pseudomonadota bacterium]
MAKRKRNQIVKTILITGATNGFGQACTHLLAKAEWRLSADEEIANVIGSAAMQPPHVNLNQIEVLPVYQNCGSFNIHRAE